MILAFATIVDESDRDFVIRLYEEYYGLVRKMVYGITLDSSTVEDLINDAFVKLIDKIPLLRTFESCTLVAYVVSTARRVAINFIRRRDVQNRHTYFTDDSELLGVAELATTIEDLVTHQQGIDSMWSAILQLPDSQKDLLYFKYILEMDDAVIAEILAISPASVRQYLTRARREARRLMEKGCERA